MPETIAARAVKPVLKRKVSEGFVTLQRAPKNAQPLAEVQDEGSDKISPKGSPAGRRVSSVIARVSESLSPTLRRGASSPGVLRRSRSGPTMVASSERSPPAAVRRPSAPDPIFPTFLLDEKPSGLERARSASADAVRPTRTRFVCSSSRI